MVPTILLITKPDEVRSLAGPLRKGLFADLRLLLLSDLDDTLSPEEQLDQVQPHALLLGTGQLGIDVAAYIEAARQHHPECAICLICEPGFAERARRLYPDRLLLRPVTGAEVLQALRGMLPGQEARSSQPGSRVLPPGKEHALNLDEADLLEARQESATRPEPSVVVSADLLRADELLGDPLSLWGAGAGSLKDEPPVRKSRLSGQFDVVVTSPPEKPVPEQPKVTVEPSIFAPQDQPPQKRPGVSVDPSLYEDALAGIDVNSLDPEARAPVAVTRAVSGPGRTGPPPLPGTMEPPPRKTPPPLPLPVRASRTLELEGDLQTFDPPSLVGRLFITKYSGCLQIFREGRDAPDLAERTLYFSQGELVAASSSLAVDSLPELLYREGRLSREQLKRARQVLAEAPPKVEGGNHALAQRLAEEQLLPRTEVLPLLMRHVIEIFYRTFTWEKGRYRLLTRGPIEEDVVKLKGPPRLLLLEGLRRKASLEMLQKRVGPEGTVLYPLGKGPALLQDAGITAAEQRALPFFDGRHTVGQVAARSGLAEHATYVLAYTLICLGALGDRVLWQARPSAPQPILQRAPTAAPPGPDERPETRANAEAMARIRAKYQQVGSGDYFTLLGLFPSATAIDIRRAYESLRADLSGRNLSPGQRAEVAVQVEQIAAVLDEACALLSDDKVRASYQAHLLPQ